MKVSYESERVGVRTRRKFIGGSLVSLLTMDQLSEALAEPTDSEPVMHGANSAAKRLRGQAAMNSSQSKVNSVVQKTLDTSLRATRLRSVLDFQQRDASLLLHGDSTGNEDFEFFYQTVLKLCAMYPSHTVLYRLWNIETEAWDLRKIQTGTGPRVLRVHNGSVPGANPVFWHGRLKKKAYDGIQFDMVMVNYGLNTETSLVVQKSALASGLYTLLREQPDAELVVNIQPPDFTTAERLQRSQLRADAQRAVTDEFGVSTIDVFTLFTNLVKKGKVSDWYKDGIHPNAAGSRKWAELAVYSLLQTSAKQRGIGIAPARLPNYGFARGVNLSSATWWHSSVSIARVAAAAETGAYALRVKGTASTGVVFIDASALVRSMEQARQIVIAARVKTTGSSFKPGIVYMSTGNPSGSDYVELRGSNNGDIGEGSGAYRWAFLVVPRSFYYAKSNVRIGIFSGDTGESVDIDRVLIGGDCVVPESDGVSGFESVFEYADSTFTISSKKVAYRRIGGEIFQPGGRFTVDFSGELPEGVFLTTTLNGAGKMVVNVHNTKSSKVIIPAGNWIVTVR